MVAICKHTVQSRHVVMKVDQITLSVISNRGTRITKWCLIYRLRSQASNHQCLSKLQQRDSLSIKHQIADCCLVLSISSIIIVNNSKTFLQRVMVRLLPRTLIVQWASPIRMIVISEIRSRGIALKQGNPLNPHLSSITHKLSLWHLRMLLLVQSSDSLCHLR